MVKFVSYDYTSFALCCGKLVLEIDGKIRNMPDYCMCSGGSVGFNGLDEYVTSGPWTVDCPEDLEQYREEIERVVNENVPWGCCGGCI